MEISIFGGGVAGLTTAVALRAAGHRCRVYEKCRDRFAAGMGFILTAESTRRLARFGVTLAGDAAAVLTRFCRHDPSGAVTHVQDLPAGVHGIRRRDLTGALLSRLPGDAVVADAEVVAVEVDDAHAVVDARLASGARVGADLYVGADGARSRTRRALLPGWRDTDARVFDLVGLVRSPDTVAWADNQLHKFVAPGGGVAFGLVPVDARHVVWYLQFDTARFPPPRTGGPAQLDFGADLVAGWAAPVPQLLWRTDPADVHLWRPVDADPPYRCHGTNLALVGDAAHPLLPFTSQGVLSAIADAGLLAAALTDQATLPDTLPDALAGYAAASRARCAPHVSRGRELSRQFIRPATAGADLLPLTV